MFTFLIFKKIFSYLGRGTSTCLGQPEGFSSPIPPYWTEFKLSGMVAITLYPLPSEPFQWSQLLLLFISTSAIQNH